jgi:hypothetical protein
MHIDDEKVLARTMFVDTTGVRATDFDLDDRTQETSTRKAARRRSNSLRLGLREIRSARSPPA